LNLLEILACPKCLAALYTANTYLPFFQCSKCNRQYFIVEGIPIFPDPPSDRREYDFEVKRYNRIALTAPKEWGLNETYPETRVSLFKEAVKENKAHMYLNVGAGFGQLEESMPEVDKVCLDHAVEFLRLIQKKNVQNSYFVNGFAERMPFRSEAFPCVLSDSVFQTVVDQKEFLFESARVLKTGGLFLLAIAYKWNYPRKPQAFPADNPELLIRFLHELGIEAEAIFYDLRFKVKRIYEDGDYLLVKGVKKE